MSEAKESRVPRRPYVPPTIEPLGKLADPPPARSAAPLICDSPTIVCARPLDQVSAKANQER